MIRCNFCNKVSPDDAVTCDCGTILNHTLATKECDPVINVAGILAGGNVITGINIPFLSLVGLLLKIMLAAIPAVMIIAAAFMLVSTFFTLGLATLFTMR